MTMAILYGFAIRCTASLLGKVQLPSLTSSKAYSIELHLKRTNTYLSLAAKAVVEQAYRRQQDDKTNSCRHPNDHRHAKGER